MRKITVTITDEQRVAFVGDDFKVETIDIISEMVNENQITLTREKLERMRDDAALSKDRSRSVDRNKEHYYQGMIDLVNGLIMQMEDPSLRD